MAPTATRHTRIKKLNKSQGQQILREDQVDEYDSFQAQSSYESGVEKAEEQEYHLQAALASSSTGEKEGEIPAPPAEESTGIDYDSLYTLKFDKPATYIRFSQTVEECTGCQYDMTTEDDVFLKEQNQKKAAPAKCSEDDFEKIMEIFEETAEIQSPFASIDNTVIPFESMKQGLKQQVVEKLHVFAKDIYEYWKKRRQETGNGPLQPSLKFETHQDNDDGDPYVCFRRREVRQTRKTRARDVQSTEKLKRLRKEIEEGRALVALVHLRECTKNQLLQADRDIFEQRVELKRVKKARGIKTDDDELLINQKPQKRKVSDFPQLQRPSGTQLRLPPRADGRAIEADLILLSDVIAQKENMLQTDLQEKAKQHEVWNLGFEDLTREPLSPVSQGSQPAFRPATAQYQLMTPPSSVTSEPSDHPSPTQEKPDPFTFRYSSPPEEDEPRGQPAYRRRIGRCGRLWIDRRGMPSTVRGGDDIATDRWKYDQDDDDEQPVYEMDPYDTKALRFRATIPLPHNLLSQRIRQESVQQARVNGASPTNNRSIATAPQPSAPT